MDVTTEDLLVWVQERQQTMIEQLHQFCNINSGTDNLPGLHLMHQALHTAFMPLADTLETYAFPALSTVSMAGELSAVNTGNALLIRKRPDLSRRILLSGHMDTVYPSSSAFQTLTYISDNHLNGPAVSDMKGGLIIILQALSAFEQTPLATTIGWDVLINADEEIGSPASATLFGEIANHYQAGLVYEPAVNPQGSFAKNRKGSGKLTLIATGKSAHAGRSFYEGRNAICYLAEAIIAIHALNGKREGVTINVGKIAGGDALNSVPDKAVVKLDIRISQTADEHWVREQLGFIIQQLQRKDYSLSLHGDFARPVKIVNNATFRLFERIATIGQQLGLAINWQDSGGCCDGNNLAQYGLPVIDTLGVRGGNIHSHDEYILLDSLVERTLLSTLLLVDLAKGGLEDLHS